MSTDRELLEAAAKAVNGGAWHPLTHDTPNGTWNPLTDDGDAFRLAVALRIDIHTSPINGDAVVVTAKRRMRSDLLRQPNPTTAVEDYAPDPAAATRRAIVRAAAALGSKG